jgi:hypothetical protein
MAMRLLVLAVVLVFAGCSGAVPSALPPPTAVAVTAPPTPRPTPTATPRPTPTPTPRVTPVPTPTPTPTPPPTPTVYEKLTDREWALLVKDPDKYLGKAYQVWACIFQFDAATGTESFLAQAANEKLTYWYSDGDNAAFLGDEEQLADFIESDVIFMNVISLGSYSYDTQAGGNTTVPLFKVDKITPKESCE